MKIVILNGSPKGDLSVTMQYILYIQKKFPQHEFKILNIAQQIKILEKSQDKFQAIIEEVRTSNGVIWGFPLYVMLVPSQYKRFIELIYERKVGEAFKNKYATLICTSVHFYDHTAVNYINAISDDLEMNFVGHFSAESMDLMKEDQRRNLIFFAEDFINTIENELPISKKFQPLILSDFEYKPKPSEILNKKEKIDVKEKIILIITDSKDENTNLGRMIKNFQNCFSSEIEVLNIYDINIKGGCLGCIHCGYDNQCVYKDEYMDLYIAKLKKADIIVYAGTIKDRYLSARWKMMFDRSFFNGHVPIVKNRQTGYIISGPLGQIPNLRQIINAMNEFSENNLVGIITDEYMDSKDIDLIIYNFAKKLVKFSISNYINPGTYLSVGGNKILRDMIYRTRFVFQADHRYYEENGLYDFPQNDIQAKKMNEMFIPLINNDEKFRKAFYDRTTSEMIKPLQNIVKDPNK